MKKPLLMAVALVALGGCGGELDELKQFVRESDKGLPRKIEPLPAVKPFEPFTYEGFDLPDPFKPRKLSSAPCAQPPCGGPAPDLNRRKEPLEPLPLDQLNMVGTLSPGPATHAPALPAKPPYRLKKT